VKWESEEELDRFLFENPGALSHAIYPDEGANCLVPIARQVWGIDILYLRLPTSQPPEPGLLLCEDKKGSNPDLRRKVLGQVIEYAARIDQMDERAFEAKLVEQLAQTDVKAVHRRCIGSGTLEIEDAAACLPSAVAAKQNRMIECVICARNIPDSLKQMVNWFNTLVQGRASPPVINLCTAKQLRSEDTAIVEVASALALLDVANTAALSGDDDRELLRIASDLLEMPALQTHLAEVGKAGPVVAAQSLVRPRPARSSGQGSASREQWLNQVPGPQVRELYDMLERDVLPEKRWDLGQATGAQLVLKLIFDDAPRPMDILRLKEASVSFVPFNFLADNGLDEIAVWARQRLSDLGAGKPSAPQPSISAETLAASPELSPQVVRFVNELGERVGAALRPV
jgi:hypothetical protein